MREKQGVRFHRIRDFKQYCFSSIPPTSHSLVLKPVTLEAHPWVQRARINPRTVACPCRQGLEASLTCVGETSRRERLRQTRRRDSQRDFELASTLPIHTVRIGIYVVRVCIYIYIYIHIHTCTHIYIYAYVCMYVYIYIYIYVYIYI